MQVDKKKNIHIKDHANKDKKDEYTEYIEEYGREKLKFNENSPKFELKSDAEYKKENKNL